VAADVWQPDGPLGAAGELTQAADVKGGDSMETTLKMIYTLTDGKTMTISLAAPREDLKQSEVDAVAKTIVEKKAFVQKGAAPVALKKAYIHSVEDKALA